MWGRVPICQGFQKRTSRFYCGGGSCSMAQKWVANTCSSTRWTENEREYHQSVKVFRREEQFLLWKGKLSTPQWRWVARSLGQNQRATATEILLVEMFHHSRSQSHMRMQIVSPHGTCPCPHFRRVNRANHMVPKVSIWVKTSSSFFPHGLLADVVSGKWEPTFTCCNC